MSGMAMLLTNAILLELDPVRATHGTLRVRDGVIREVGNRLRARAEDEVVDCGGAVVLPGLVNGHAHLYSALAVGMPPPRRSPADFSRILDYIWWRLDRALDPESIELSAMIGALDALHCGTTTLIDHHASPNCIAGSLDLLERGLDAVGLRGVLCYEVTDRRGAKGAAAGLEENRRYLEKRRNAETSKRQDTATPQRRNAATPKCRSGKSGGGGARRFAGMVGAHAAFTLSDASLEACARLAEEYRTGVHMHAAEDPGDDRICRERYGASLVARLRASGLLGPGSTTAGRSILAHGTHLSPADARRISARLAAVAHNPRSNMNNRVGYAPVVHMRNVMLGTDGIGSDMFGEARCAWLKARDAAAWTPEQRNSAPRGGTAGALGPAEIVAMLAHGARVAGDYLGGVPGRLTAGAAADLVVTDYVPATPLDETNVAGHLIFALGPQHVRHVMIGGDWALRDRRAMHVDESAVRRHAAEVARRLWSRLKRL